MAGYLLRRVIGTIPVILLISLLVFLLIHAAPGDPADLLLSDQATPQDIAEARHRWGLDQPLYVQYLRFLVNVLKGDFGTSFRYSDPVITVISERLPATIELAVVSLLVALALGLPLGVWAGAKPNSWADNLGSFFGFFGISMPNFWFGIMLILVVAGYLNWLPSSGRSTYGIARGSDTGFYIVASLLAGNFRRSMGWSEAYYSAGNRVGHQHDGNHHARHPLQRARSDARGFRAHRAGQRHARKNGVVAARVTQCLSADYYGRRA